MIQEDTDLKCVIMLNCGGNVDLFESFHLDEREQLLILVVDSHRPYHPTNVKNAQNIFIFDDSMDTETSNEIDAEDVESLAATFQTQEDEQQDEDEEDEEDEEEDDSFVEDDDEMMDENSMDADVRRPKKTRSRKNRKQQANFGLVAASDSSRYGFTCSGLMYSLALQLGVDRRDLLWYGILGLTDQYVHQRINSTRYQGDLQYFADKVKSFEESNEAAYASLHRSREVINLTNPQSIALTKKEYIFTLYRHWNLYDSVFHTRSIAVRLGIWRHDGKKNLERWLAQMGMPLEESKQKYVAMKKKFKDHLPPQLEKYAPDFGINDLYVTTFLRRPSFDKEVSAFDVIYGMSSLLESIKPTHNQGSDAGMDIDSEEDLIKVNFWNAYRSLNQSNSLLEEGIDEAIELQCAILRQASQMIQRQEIGRSGPYRYAVIKDTMDSKFFSQPLALSQLAHFLVDTIIEMSRSKTCKPLIVASFLPSSSQFLVVGIEGQHSSDLTGSNHFGKAFANAAANTRTDIIYSTFDTSAVKIPQQHLEKFREFLRSGLVIDGV